MANVFLGLGAAAALVYWTQIATDRPTGDHWLRSLAKTAATLALAAAGLASPAPGLIAPMLIVLGLALGAAGDFCLSRPGQVMFLAGMATFATGHLAYVAAFWLWTGAFSPTPTQVTALLGLGLGVLGLGLWLSAQAGALRGPVFGYALVIGLMAGSALVLPASPGTGTIQVGVALFLLSDTLLALRLFVAGPTAQKPLDLLVWPAYWLGQALILTGTCASWGFPKV